MMTIKTSMTHPIRVDWLRLSGPGRVGMTFAPGKHGPSKYTEGSWARDLETDLKDLVEQWKATDLVCLLEQDELKLLRIPTLLERAEAHGLRVHPQPIPDGGVLPGQEPVRKLLRVLIPRFEEGARIVIHCAGGLGRTGTIAGCFLVARGVEAEQALRMLQKTRSDKCPETDEQRDFIRQFRMERG